MECIISPIFGIMNNVIGNIIICPFIPVDVVVITALPEFSHCLIIGFFKFPKIDLIPMNLYARKITSIDGLASTPNMILCLL